jgi:hypothetical protein
MIRCSAPAPSSSSAENMTAANHTALGWLVRFPRAHWCCLTRIQLTIRYAARLRKSPRRHYGHMPPPGSGDHSRGSTAGPRACGRTALEADRRGQLASSPAPCAPHLLAMSLPLAWRPDHASSATRRPDIARGVGVHLPVPRVCPDQSWHSESVRLANQPSNRMRESSFALIRDPKPSRPDRRGHVACRCLLIRWVACQCLDPVGGRKGCRATYRVVQETVGKMILQQTNG